MYDIEHLRPKSPWETFWIAIAAIAAAIATVVAAWTAWEAKSDAKENRKQTLAISKGTVMSSCMSEYFTIRRDAMNGWNPESGDSRENVRARELYSEQMFGLHFKEYHLYQNMLIPRHVYIVWLKDLKHDIEAKEEPLLLPRPDLKPYINRNPKEDFNDFMSKILSSGEDKIEALVASIERPED